MNNLLKNRDAFLFDLDGTLVDSMWMWKEIDIEYLGKFGHDCPEQLQRTIEGMSFSETAVYFKEYFSIPDTIEQIKQDWIRMSIDKYRHAVPLKTGARELLEYGAANHIPMGIATSNGMDMVEAVLQSLNIRPFFQTVITGCEVAKGKPAPDIYLEAAKRLQAQPAHCLVFEDVPAGITAGKAAGMTVIAVDDEFSRDMKEEKKRLADYFIRDYHDLLRSRT